VLGLSIVITVKAEVDLGGYNKGEIFFKIFTFVHYIDEKGIKAKKAKYTILGNIKMILINLISLNFKQGVVHELMSVQKNIFLPDRIVRLTAAKAANDHLRLFLIYMFALFLLLLLLLLFVDYKSLVGQL